MKANFVFKFFSLVFSLFPQNCILFESKPDFSDNTFAVYDYMVKNNVLPKYKKIWLTTPEKGKTTINNKRIKNSLLRRLYVFYYKTRSKVIVFCNSPIQKTRKNQISVYLCHGSKSKKTRDYYTMPQDLDYILVQADMFKEAVKYGYDLSDHTKMITLGYPRNDDLLKKTDIDRQSLFDTSFQKLLIWYPTFRKYSHDPNAPQAAEIPVIHDKNAVEALNACAAENGVLIVLKPHFAQNVSHINELHASHIKVINDSFFQEKNIRSYQLLSLTDGLLTDYSSVYYDYLLTDRPIGMVWEDYDLYKSSKGFALDPDVVYAGGEKIFTTDDFCDFIQRIAKGEDVLKEQRSKIRDMSNIYKDAGSSQRVSEFITELLEGSKNGKKV